MAKHWDVLSDRGFVNAQFKALKSELETSKDKLLKNTADQRYFSDVEEAYQEVFNLLNEAEVWLKESNFTEVVKKIDIISHYSVDSLMVHTDHVMIIDGILSKLKDIKISRQN